MKRMLDLEKRRRKARRAVRRVFDAIGGGEDELQRKVVDAVIAHYDLLLHASAPENNFECMVIYAATQLVKEKMFERMGLHDRIVAEMTVHKIHAVIDERRLTVAQREALFCAVRRAMEGDTDG